MKYLFLFLFILLVKKSSGQNFFEKSYLIQGNKQAGVSILENNSVFYLTSISDDCGSCASSECLISLDDTGKVLFNKVFSKGTSDESVGNLIAAANSFYFPITYDHFNFTTATKEISLTKVDHFGNLLVETILRDTLMDLQCVKIVCDDSLNIYCIVNTPNMGVRIYKVNSYGLLLWEKTIGSFPNISQAIDALVKNNELFILGYGINNTFLKTIFCKVDTSGSLLTTNEYSNPDSIRGISLNKSGNEFVISGQQFDSIGNAQITIMITDSSGQPISLNRINSVDKEYVFSSAVDDQSNILLTGTAIDTNQDANLLVTKTNSVGNLIWKKRFCLQDSFGCYSSLGRSIVEAADHSIVVCGQVENVANYPKIYIVKIDSSGLFNFVSDLSIIQNGKPFVSFNLVSKQVTITDLNEPFEISIYDQQGRFILSEHNETKFTLPTISSAIYFYQIRTKYKIFSDKLSIVGE